MPTKKPHRTKHAGSRIANALFDRQEVNKSARRWLKVLLWAVVIGSIGLVLVYFGAVALFMLTF